MLRKHEFDKSAENLQNTTGLVLVMPSGRVKHLKVTSIKMPTKEYLLAFELDGPYDEDKQETVTATLARKKETAGKRGLSARQMREAREQSRKL